MSVDVLVLGALDENIEDLASEVLRVKASLLYGDRIFVESHKVPFLLGRMAAKTRLASMQLRKAGAFDRQTSADVADELERRGFLESGPNAEFMISLLRGSDPQASLELPELLAEMIREKGARGDGSRFFRAVAPIAVMNYMRSHPQDDPRAVVRAVEELVALSDSGFVTVDTGGTEELTHVDLEEVEGTFVRSVERALEVLTDPSSTEHPLFSASTRLALRALGKGRGIPGAYFTRANRVELAARLIAAIPSFPHARVDELLDVRERVAPHLDRFRAAVSDLERQLQTDVVTNEFDAAVEDLRQQEVAPALEALHQSLDDLGAIPTLARGVPTVSVSALALGASVAMGAPDLAGVAAVVAGASTALAKEFLERHEQENRRKEHRLFLLFDAERMLAQR